MRAGIGESHLSPTAITRRKECSMTHAELVYEHLKNLPESVAAEVLDFVQFLERKHEGASPSQPRQPGSARGQIWVAEDFDAPLDDFKDYE
jgi:hypothetical protein